MPGARTHDTITLISGCVLAPIVYLALRSQDVPGQIAAGSAAHSIADWLVTGGKHILRRVGLRVIRDYSGHDQQRHPRERRARFREGR